MLPFLGDMLIFGRGIFTMLEGSQHLKKLTIIHWNKAEVAWGTCKVMSIAEEAQTVAKPKQSLNSQLKVTENERKTCKRLQPR